MPVEIVGTTLRIRVKSPKGGIHFRTHDLGGQGRLQRVAGMYRGKWHTQSWRLRLPDYTGYGDAMYDLEGLYHQKQISKTKLEKAMKLLKKWYGR